MRRGSLSPLMYLILAVITLLAIIFLIMGLANRSWSIIDMIREALR